MSDTKDSYCRLCAEPTLITEMISIDDDVGLHSKIANKMQWLNVDVTQENQLPKNICYSCFDLLERAWRFLDNVRTAQKKLKLIFCSETSKNKSEPGKPVDADWDEFCTKTTCPKPKSEPHYGADFCAGIKDEPNSDIDAVISNYSSEDEKPLKSVAKDKKKLTEAKKDEIIKEIQMSMFKITWVDYIWYCGHCEAYCKSVELLRIHSIEQHSLCCKFKCIECTKILTNYKSFVNHVKTHYSNLVNFCDICNKYIKQPSLLKKHKKSAHKDLFLYYCPTCGISFDSADTLYNHLQLYSKTKTITTQRNLELKCDVCEREFKSRSNLQQHKTVHMERSRDFSCHVCGKMFYTKGALSTHMSTHEDVKPFKCEFCHMSFRARGNLTAHISLHSAARPFVCEQCGKSFRVKRHLKSHSIVHTDLMPYVCNYCNKTFRFKTRLNLHVRQHTGSKPYSCEYCRRDFTNGSNYKKHMRRRHNIDTSVRNKLKIVEKHEDETKNNDENEKKNDNVAVI